MDEAPDALRILPYEVLDVNSSRALRTIPRRRHTIRELPRFHERCPLMRVMCVLSRGAVPEIQRVVFRSFVYASFQYRTSGRHACTWAHANDWRGWIWGQYEQASSDVYPQCRAWSKGSYALSRAEGKDQQTGKDDLPTGSDARKDVPTPRLRALSLVL